MTAASDQGSKSPTKSAVAASKEAPEPRAQVVVLAGGLATRMRPRTADLPKFLLPVAGRPFGVWLLERLARCGFEDVLLCIGHLGQLVRDAIGDGGTFGVRVRYCEDGPTLLGTAGALRKALDLLEPSFLTTYGDSYLPFDYMAPLADLRAHPEALGTMAVHHNRDRWEPSNAAVEGELVVRYEKGRAAALDHIDYGATALRREVVARLPEGIAVGLESLQARLAVERRLRALVARERFYEIGSQAGLADLEAHLRGREHEDSSSRPRLER